MPVSLAEHAQGVGSTSPHLPRVIGRRSRRCPIVMRLACRSLPRALGSRYFGPEPLISPGGQ